MTHNNTVIQFTFHKSNDYSIVAIEKWFFYNWSDCVVNECIKQKITIIYYICFINDVIDTLGFSDLNIVECYQMKRKKIENQKRKWQSCTKRHHQWLQSHKIGGPPCAGALDDKKKKQREAITTIKTIEE